MSNFIKFKTAVAAKFAELVTTGLYRSAASKDDLWSTYLLSFPEGTNPIYKERTEYDCTCCKQFIRAVGNTISIVNGEVVSIWDITVDDPTYQTVADALSKFSKAHPIENKFLHDEPKAGTDKNFQDTGNCIVQWNHFFVNVPKQYVEKDMGPKLGGFAADYEVTKRGFDELTTSAVDTVIELIEQNSLYRGQEHLAAVRGFRNMQQLYLARPTSAFVWEHCAPQTRFRNTVIGTLVQDLSAGVSLEDAVKMFESKVAPANYKRPTALVTKAMVEKAKAKLEELGLTSALERRYATIDDITINNILFADRTTPLVKDVFDDLIATAPAKTFEKVEEISIEKFITDVLPRAAKIEVMVENSHQGNLMSLIAPVDPTANNLFKWGNKFSWDYNGGVADSIKERVKAAGGNVTGEFCCRLAWNNTDDLDLHMFEPTGAHLFYANRGRKSTGGGDLDVDANGGSGMMDNPVENIYYQSLSTMQNGLYALKVNNYRKRSTLDQGFEVEIELQGQTYNYSQDANPSDGQNVDIAIFEKTIEGLKLKTPLKENKRVKNVWGINTNTFTKVNVVMNSPNYWDGEEYSYSGNKHYFFMLDGCKNDGQARGFFNEFLKGDLTEHRKTLEMVGARMLTDKADQQLSGLGFSSTQRNSLVVRVTGAFTRNLRILF